MFITELVYNLIVQHEWHKTNKWKDVCGIPNRIKRTYICVREKNLAMECDRKEKSDVYNWHEKKHAQKNCPTLPSKI